MHNGAAYSGEIIDAHCHIASTDFIPEDFLIGVARNIVAKLNATGVNKSVAELCDTIRAQHQDHDADGLVREMSESGIAKAVALLPDFTWVSKSELTIAEMIARHRAIAQRHPDRFFMLVGVDPRWGPDGIRLFESVIEEPCFHGLKLYPPCGYSPSDKSLYPYFELCRAHRAPVLLHVGPTAPNLTFNYSNPWLIDQAALDFPDVNFILAHACAHFVKDCLSLAEYRPNIYLDISAFPSIAPAPSGWKAVLPKFFRHGINHKILFGTDWPLYGAGRHARLIDTFTGQAGPLRDVSPAQRRWIMHDNILRLIAS